jgi:hypothetical protein
MASDWQGRGCREAGRGEEGDWREAGKKREEKEERVKEEEKGVMRRSGSGCCVKGRMELGG